MRRRTSLKLSHRALQLAVAAAVLLAANVIPTDMASAEPTGGGDPVVTPTAAPSDSSPPSATIDPTASASTSASAKPKAATTQTSAVTSTPTADASKKALAVDGHLLEGARVDSPVSVQLSASADIAGEVTWLLDDAFYKKSTSAPHSISLTTTPGAHKLKARWVTNAAGDTAFVQSDFLVGPYLAVGGAPLDDGDVTSPTTVTVENASTVSGTVTWLVDDKYAGKDTAAPYTWDVAVPRGAHKVKARWSAADGTTVEIAGQFTVQTDLDWKAPEEIREEPGAALSNLWVAADNRRAPVDGVYDWSKAGFGGGTVLPNDSNVRPEATCQVSAAQMSSTYGVVPNDGGDDTAGIQAAIDHIKADCSPTGDYTKMSRILLPAGTLNVSHEIHVDADYLLIRGAAVDGPNRTRLEYAPDANTRYDTITKDGTRWDLDAMGDGEANGGWLWPGRGLFRVQSRQVAPRYADAYAAAPANRKDLYEGTINDHWTTGLTLRGKPGDTNYAGRKGDKVLYLAANSSFDNLKVGGLVNVMAANSTKFYDSMKTLPTDHPLDNLYMRQQIFMVTAGDPAGKTITLDKPLEYDVPVTSISDGSEPIDGKTVNSKLSPLVDAVVGVGFENLSLTQVEPGLDQAKARDNYGNMDPAAAMHGIVFKWAANSWVKGIRTEMTGSHPIVTEDASNLSIVDNYLDGSWNKGKGGNGYFRGSRVWDSLYAGNAMRNLRHFTFQWSASGNVAIGNSTDADLNLHGGYERNNLFELNQVSTPYAHRPDNCWTNCGGEGADNVDDADWYPIWWAAGKKAVKWSGSSGPNNVFFNNVLRKQHGSGTAPYEDYGRYDRLGRIYQLGVDPDGTFHHLDVDGTPIADWNTNETRDFSNGHGVVASRTDPSESLFLNAVAQNGYGGPHPQPLRRTWGCSCWDGRGMVNTRLAADPVNTATGSLIEQFTDLSIAGLGEGLTLGRTYNSLDPTDGPFGTGWTYSYNASVRRDPDGFYYFREPTGSQAQFERGADGRYASKDAGVTATLADRSGGGWTVTNLAGGTMTFDATGRLTAIRDIQNHGVTLTYSGTHLQTVTDTLGQTLTIGWTGEHITSVGGSDGHTVQYTFTTAAGASRLTAVRGIDAKTTTYGYDTATGFLNQITDPDGRTTVRTTYDPTSKRVVAQKDANGDETTFSWDADRQIATVTDPSGAVTKDLYDDNVLIGTIGAGGVSDKVYYDANNHPIATTDANQNTTAREYDAAGNLLTETRAARPGSAAVSQSWTYDSQNRVLTETDFLGHTTTYEYDAAGNQASKTEANGHVTRWTYNQLGLPLTETDPNGHVTTMTYSSTGDLLTSTTATGETTSYAYDGAHNKVAETDPRGTAAGASAAEKEKYTSHWTYDDFGRVLTEQNALDETTTNVYDAVGNLTKTTAPNGAVTTYTYDSVGRVLTETDDAARTTRYTYDGAGNLIKTVSPGGKVTTSTFDGDGNELSSTDPIGNATGASAADKVAHTVRYGYDANGNQTTVRTPDPTKPGRYLTTTTVYDAADQPIASTDATGRTSTTEYDANGQEVRTVDFDGTVTVTAYDAVGQVTSSTDHGSTTTSTYDPAGNLTSETTGGRTSTFSYDDANRLTSQTSPRGNAPGATASQYTSRYTYDAAGNQKTSTDPASNTTTTAYDAENRPAKVTLPAGGTQTYGYDTAGNVTSVTDPNGNLTKNAFNKVGDLTRSTNPRGGVTVYTYDGDGQVASVTTPVGKTTSYGYDANGQLTLTTLPSGTVGRSYDALGRPVKIDYSGTTPDVTSSYDSAGRLTSRTNGNATSDYSYDTAGHLTAITRGNAATKYTWDANGRIASRTYPDGRVQQYQWDTDGVLTGTTYTTAGQAQNVGFTYDADLNTTQITRSNGPTTTLGWDPAGRPTQLTSKQGASAIFDQSLTWTANDEPKRVSTTASGSTRNVDYTYDSGGQVTATCLYSGSTCGTSGSKTSYTYDANGNRTKVVAASGTTTSSFDADDQLVRADGPTGATTYTYGSNGDLQKEVRPDGTRTYTYGLDGNLYNAHLQDNTDVNYSYDEDGNRVQRTLNGSVDAAWGWDTLGDQPTRISETGASSHRWFVDPTSDLGGSLIDASSTGVPTWVLTDFQGSVIGTAKTGTLTGTARYGAYGEEVTSTGSVATLGLGFQSQYRDSATGLYDMRARDYDPGAGRFTDIDPELQATGGAWSSTYSFVGGKTTTLSDPSGRCPWCIASNALSGMIGGLAGMITKPKSPIRETQKPHFAVATPRATGGNSGGQRTPFLELRIPQPHPYSPAGRQLGRQRPQFTIQAQSWLSRNNVGPWPSDLSVVLCGTNPKMPLDPGRGGGGGGGSSMGRGGGTGAGGDMMGPGRVAGRTPGDPKGRIGASRGSTGRQPANYREYLAMEEVRTNPGGKKLTNPMTDPRWPGEKGWEKWGQASHGYDIHYVRNKYTGEVDDFKIKMEYPYYPMRGTVD